MAAVRSVINQWTRLPPAQMWAEASRVLPPWVSLLLVVLIGWQLASTPWLLVPAEDPAEVPLSRGPSQPLESGSATAVNIDRIVAAHLFGQASAEGAQPVAEQEDAPDTQLSLELRGTIVASEDGRAVAIIAERGGAERVFFVGDALPGGASLHSVYEDRVLLRRGARLEALRLPRSGEEPVARQAAPPPRASAPPARAATIQEVVRQGASSLTEVIRPQPVFKDGRQQGYRVYPGRQRQQFAQLGLRPGDLITQINGMALDDPARGMEIFRGLADATSVTVTVDRNGQVEMLTLNTATLQQELQSISEDGTPTE